MGDADVTEAGAQAHYEQLSQATVAALGTVAEMVPHLAILEVQEQSADGRVIVRATAAGSITAITLRGGALERYGSDTLGKVVADTVRAAQVRAGREYERAVNASVPDAVAQCTRVIRDSVRE